MCVMEACTAVPVDTGGLLFGKLLMRIEIHIGFRVLCVCACVCVCAHVCEHL